MLSIYVIKREGKGNDDGGFVSYLNRLGLGLGGDGKGHARFFKGVGRSALGAGAFGAGGEETEMREVKQLVKYWPGDIVRDHFGQVYRVQRLSVIADIEEEDLLTSYVCVRASGLYRQQEFLEGEIEIVRAGKNYES